MLNITIPPLRAQQPIARTPPVNVGNQVTIPRIPVAAPKVPLPQPRPTSPTVTPKVPLPQPRPKSPTITPIAIPAPKVPIVTPKVPLPIAPIPQGRTIARSPLIPTQAVPLPTVKVTIPTIPKNIVTIPVPKPTLVRSPVVPQPPIAQPPIPQYPIPKVTTLNVQPKFVIPQPTGRGPIDITLYDYQVGWANRAYDILLRNHGYIDTSRPRSGKTLVALWLAKRYGFPLIIICPKTLIAVWKREADKYGVEIIVSVSYQSLRSKQGARLKHGLLDRFDNTTEGGVHQIHFVPTQYYLSLIERGALLICDEIHNIKNNSDQYKACNALIRPIISGAGRSRFALLSATPFDKEEHAINLLRLIGYIRAHRLYNYDRVNQAIVLEGVQELIDACRAINPAETARVLIQVPPTIKKNIKHLVYVLYINVIRAAISGAMARPETGEGTFDVKNGFFNMTANRGFQLHTAVTALARAVNYDERTDTVDMRGGGIGGVTPALVAIENAKVDDFARVATQILMDYDRNKVVISVNYTSTIDEIKRLLIFYHPLTLNGQIPEAKRQQVIADFVGNPTRRVLLMNTAVGKEGISLYSTEPDSPVFMLVSPSYRPLDITQVTSRIYGPGMVSPAVARIFYGKLVGERETSILNALARKTEVLKGVLEDVVKADLILPGDYPSYHEQ